MTTKNGEATDSPVLEARDLTKHFALRSSRGSRKSRATRSQVAAVNRVTLSLRAGTTVALVGESGSGKSTIARLLAQLYRPSAGAVLLHGAPVRIRSSRGRRAYVRQVQLLLQDPFASLNPVHTVRYHLTRVLRIHGYLRRGVDADELLDELLTRVQLTPPERFLDKLPHQLSGGQLQRVAIARTLAARPAVLLADEPVSMLDVSIRLGILRLLTRLKEEEHLALLYITHDIASARYFAEETLVMYRGHLVEGGPSEEVTQHPAHPYTQLLISSAPDPDRRGADDPPAARPPVRRRPDATGCPFAGRCPQTMDLCLHEMPEVTDLGEGHWARCWLHTPQFETKANI
ncbi:MAG: ABC transporter ATP-binding protein [Actinoallomurus sp.]